MNTVKRILHHKIFLYGMIFISVLQLLNFYKANSFVCLGTFGITYYIVNMSTKNQGVCLLAANIISIFLLGCEKSDILREGNTSRVFGPQSKCSDFSELDANNAKYWGNCPTDAPPDGLGCILDENSNPGICKESPPAPGS